MDKIAKVSWLAKLTPQQVHQIRRRIAIGGKRNTGTKLAKDYGVSQSTISNLIHGKVYKRVLMGGSVTRAERWNKTSTKNTVMAG